MVSSDFRIYVKNCFPHKLKVKSIRNHFAFFTVDDDLDYLLGIELKPSVVGRLGDDCEVASRTSFAAKNDSNTLTDGWDDSSTISGWDDFDFST